MFGLANELFQRLRVDINNKYRVKEMCVVVAAWRRAARRAAPARSRASPARRTRCSPTTTRREFHALLLRCFDPIYRSIKVAPLSEKSHFTTRLENISYVDHLALCIFCLNQSAFVIILNSFFLIIFGSSQIIMRSIFIQSYRSFS